MERKLIYNQAKTDRTEEKMFCPNCGSIVQETDVLCTNCGAPLGEAKQQAQKQPAFQAAPPPQVNYQPVPPPQQPYPGYQQPYPPQPYYGAPQASQPKPNFLTSKIMITVGIAIVVCFFLSWIKGYPASGFDAFKMNFENLQYLPDVFDTDGFYGFLSLLSFIFTMFYIFIPVAGIGTFLSLTNSRQAIKSTRTFASLGFTGMIGNIVVTIIMGTIATSSYGYSSQMGSFFAEAFRYFSFAYWTCLVGTLAISITLGIDLNKNKPVRPPVPYY
jgi:hypothetical protein